VSAPLILIVGSNGSGKSAFAEGLVRRMPFKRRFYAATLQPYGEEGEQRVNKHRAQRAHDGYTTFELPRHIERIRPDPDTVVLLEDVSNLVANIVFDPAEPGGVAEALAEIAALRENAGALVAVSIKELDDAGYDAQTRRYIATLNAVNARLRSLADTVAELAAGRAVILKGELLW